MATKYDAIVIGTGQAGTSLAVRLAETGVKVAIIEGKRFGGSYVWLEFAQMYRRFGSEVTVVERGPRLIKREDEDVSENIKTILEGEGIKIRLGAECIALEKRGNKVAAQVDCRSGDKTVIGSHALLAVGRVPNTN